MSAKVASSVQELALSKRFSFGKNWRHYSRTIDSVSLEKSKSDLLQMLKTANLKDKSFLDIGSGSGLSSLSAKAAGATSIVSFDFDPLSVECTQELKNRFCSEDKNWTVLRGSILDKTFLHSLGKFDCVYSWGVLHHTGNMKLAFENIVDLVKPDGRLFIAIYNDQGSMSFIWLALKKLYNFLPGFIKPLYALCVAFPFEFRSFIIHLLRLETGLYVRSWFSKQNRGMNRFYDWIDWIGGYPFEVAKPELVFDYFHSRGFELIGLKTCGGGLGCNEYVFKKQQY